MPVQVGQRSSNFTDCVTFLQFHSPNKSVVNDSVDVVLNDYGSNPPSVMLSELWVQTQVIRQLHNALFHVCFRSTCYPRSFGYKSDTVPLLCSVGTFLNFPVLYMLSGWWTNKLIYDKMVLWNARYVLGVVEGDSAWNGNAMPFMPSDPTVTLFYYH